MPLLKSCLCILSILDNLCESVFYLNSSYVFACLLQVGMDKAIGSLTSPLDQLKQEVLVSI